MNALKELLLRHHARMKRLALFLLRNAIIPTLLTLMYFLGIGFTKVLLAFKGNPLYKKTSPDEASYWVSVETGATDEESYLRQS